MSTCPCAVGSAAPSRNIAMTHTHRIIGYARVSTDEQNLDLQIRALEDVGCDRIYTDSGYSGQAWARPGLERARKALKSGDQFVVWRLDRLGRSLLHLINLLEDLGKRKVSFRSMCEYIDTTSSGGRLVFHMMAALAEFERSLISERTRAGMAAARARGKHIGRPPSLTPSECTEARRILRSGKSLQDVAANFGVTPRTLLRLIERLPTNEGHGNCQRRCNTEPPRQSKSDPPGQ